MRRFVLVLLATVACKASSTTDDETPAAQVRDAGPVAKPIALPWRRGLPILTNTAPVPPAYAPALTAYRTATTAIAHGDLAGGATQLFAIAETLRLEDAHPHAKTFAATRCILYENAAAAYKAAKAREAAEKALADLEKSDPACAASIAKLRTRLVD